jgi:hypothetical protein
MASSRAVNNEETAELRRRLQETLDAAVRDGLISGHDDDRSSIVTGWHLVFESASPEQRWFHHLGDDHSLPWQWRGWFHEVLRHEH